MKPFLSRGTALLMLVALAGCQSAPQPDRFKPQHFVRYPLTVARKLAIQRGVIAALKNPDSAATFGIERASISTSGMIMACGFVNAKTSGDEHPRKIIYQGLLNAARPGGGLFKVTGFGGYRSQDEAIVSLCQANGIVLR